MKTARLVIAILALSLVALGCSGDTASTETDATKDAAVAASEAADAAEKAADAAEDAADAAEDAADKAAGKTDDDDDDDKDDAADDRMDEMCDKDNLATFTKGRITIATGDTVYEPWMVDDDPTNKKGFESAVAYELIDEFGFDDDEVDWVRTTFDGAISPGEKDWDFNIQQYSISEERKEVVDFSVPYYDVQQTLVATADSPVAKAKTLSDLTESKLGAAIGTTSLMYIEDVIKPTNKAQVYDDNAAAKSAIDAKLVDGLVFDLPTAYYITAVEIPEATIVGTLPVEGDTEQLGLLFPKGSKLEPCVSHALKEMHEDGTIAKLQQQWLSQGGDIAAITK